jgi:hypothetical protein
MRKVSDEEFSSMSREELMERLSHINAVFL